MRLHARHPGLHVEFVMSDHCVDLAKGKADLALRSGDTVDRQLVGLRRTPRVSAFLRSWCRSYKPCGPSSRVEPGDQRAITVRQHGTKLKKT